MSPLAFVPPGASREEVAAIVAAIAVLVDERRKAALEPPAPADPSGRLDAWVRSGRLSGRRANLARGPWRLSGRIGRRSRA